jgi:BNR repeat-like domain
VRGKGLRGRGLPTIAGAAALGLLLVSAISAGSIIPFPVSEDPYTNSGPHHKTQVEPDSFAFGQTIVTTSQSGRYYSGGGASNNVFSTSQDGGRTWVTGGLPGTTVNEGGTWPRISDPAVAYDPEHDVWLAQGLTINSGGQGDSVIVNRSTDGGLTWLNPVTVAASPGTFWDKTWIACDVWPQSPHYGNCYSQWDDNGLGNQMMMSRSTDGGLTWSSPQSPSTPSGLGGQPVVLPNGTVVVPYTGNYGAIRAFRSTNGGASWEPGVFVATQTQHSVGGSMRDPPLPSAEVDGSGRVFVVWHDCQFRAGCSSNDIVMSTSTDGLAWTAKTRIPIDPVNSTVDHFLPGIGADRANAGHLGLGYYYYPQANCSSSTCDLTYGFVSSLDGGTTWSAPTQITGAMRPIWIANTNQGYMVGDYTSTSFTADGKAHTVFSLAKPPTGRSSCYSPPQPTTGCTQRMAKATFDITAGPRPTVRVRRDPVRYWPRRRPKDAPYYPTTN